MTGAGRAPPCTRICAPHAHASVHTHLFTHAHTHARTYTVGTVCCLGRHKQSASSSSLPCHSCKGPCSGHLAIWPEQQKVPRGTIKWDTRPVPTMASATPLIGLPCAPHRGCWTRHPLSVAGGALVGQQEAWWWSPGHRGQAPSSPTFVQQALQAPAATVIPSERVRGGSMGHLHAATSPSSSRSPEGR